MSSKMFLRLLGAICACAGLGAFAMPASAAPLYPDLRMQSPSSPQIWVSEVNGQPHHQLLFGTGIANLGAGAFEIDRIPDPGNGTAELVQRIYESPVGFRDEPVTSAPWGATNATHFLGPDLARYELWTERAYNRAAARNFTRGAPLYVHDRVEHCFWNHTEVEPDESRPEIVTVDAPYTACTATTLGISVGWMHQQAWFDDNQWIDIGPQPLPDGDYVIRVIFDPNNRYFESPGKADTSRESQVANSGLTYIRVDDGLLAGIDPPFSF